MIVGLVQDPVVALAHVALEVVRSYELDVRRLLRGGDLGVCVAALDARAELPVPGFPVRGLARAPAVQGGLAVGLA